jgi:ketosteroid isomerase-like protein
MFSNVIWVVQLIISSIWSRYFYFGLLEVVVEKPHLLMCVIQKKKWDSRNPTKVGININLIKMKTLLIITLVLSTAASCKQNDENLDKEEMPESATVEELGQMNRDFATALTAKDALAAAKAYDENASILPPNEPIVTGRANIQAYWQGAIDGGIIDATVKTIDAKSSGDLGYEIGMFTMRFKGENGDTLVEVGKYTEILERNADGKWISTYGMWSANE